MTKKQPKQQRLKIIAEAAIEEFLAKGYHGASMEAIARRAGLSKGGLYHHFQSKDDVLVAANDMFYEPLEALMDRARSQPGPALGLREFIRMHLEWSAAHPRELEFLSLVASKATTNRILWRFAHIYREKMTGFLEGLLGKAVEAGELRPHDATGRAVAIFSALDGVALHLAIEGGLNPAATAMQFEQLFVDEITVKADRP